MNFINDAFKTTDIFILRGLVERQLILGKPLFICMVDFSKAFDLVNRNILIFKLTKAGFHGKVIDTLHSLYRKTVFRVKYKGFLSPPIRENYGVNGNASPMLFWQYMADLGDYLTKHFGLCITDDTIVHLLWADDLVLISNSKNGLQKHLNGLLSFCANNCMIINELKTKAMFWGHIRGHRTFISMVTRFKQYRNINTSATSSRPHQLWKAINSEIITATFVIKPEKPHLAWRINLNRWDQSHHEPHFIYLRRLFAVFYYMVAMFGESADPTMTPMIKCFISISGVFSSSKQRRVTSC